MVGTSRCDVRSDAAARRPYPQPSVGFRNLPDDDGEWKAEDGKARRAGIFVVSTTPKLQAPSRSGIIGITGRCRPDGANDFLGFRNYKYVAPNGDPNSPPPLLRLPLPAFACPCLPLQRGCRQLPHPPDLWIGGWMDSSKSIDARARRTAPEAGALPKRYVKEHGGR
jgi:hypothetical protein